MNGYATLLSAFNKNGRKARSDDRYYNYIVIPFCHRVAVACGLDVHERQTNKQPCLI